MLENKFPFVSNYFSNMLELVQKGERKFPQAIIFEGADTKSQYEFALELARILNCENSGQHSCECINCKWIRTNSHPAVNYVSQIHFKGEGDETKTVISVKQAREIEKTLLLSSDYYRFFIFFSSQKTDDGYSIEPLDYSTFHPTTPNALLKSIEEPPERTTFIFLTKSKEDILPTIVSRCLVFKLASKKTTLNYSDIIPIISNYPNINYKVALDIADNLLNYIKENSTTIETLNKFLEYLKDLIKQNIANNEFCTKITNDINIINEAIKQSKASMADKTVLETMMLKIARGY